MFLIINISFKLTLGLITGNHDKLPEKGSWQLLEYRVVDIVFRIHESRDTWAYNRWKHVISYITKWLGDLNTICIQIFNMELLWGNKGNNKITELRTILQRESQNS